jgi:hypothetical protein
LSKKEQKRHLNQVMLGVTFLFYLPPHSHATDIPTRKTICRSTLRQASRLLARRSLSSRQRQRLPPPPIQFSCFCLSDQSPSPSGPCPTTPN